MALEAVNKSIEILRHTYEWVRADYRKSIAVPLSVMILVEFIYVIFVPYFPWIEDSVYGIPVLKVIIVIIGFLVVCFTYTVLRKINERFLISFENIEKMIEDLNQTEPAIEEIKLSKQEFNDTRPFLKSVRGFLDILMSVAGDSVPFMQKTFDELTLLAKFGEKVESFELALNYYGLLEDKIFFARLSEFAPSKAHILDDEKVWEYHIVESIINKLKEQGVNLFKDVILLLYREHNGLETLDIFRAISTKEEYMESLARVLIDSKRLVQPPYNDFYKTEDIVPVLKKVGCFNLSEINNVLSRSLRQLDYLKSYTEFLVKNGIKPDFRPSIEFIIDESINENDEFERQVISLVYKIGKRAFDKIPSLDDAFKEAFAKASVSIKFHNEISFRKNACEISADERSAAVITAYYEKSKEIGAVLLEDLLKDLDLVKSSYDKRDDVEFKFLISQLREGNWFDSSGAYIKAFLDASKKEIKEQISKIEKFTILQEVVKNTFQKVRITTVEKAIDAQVFGAYIIMFSKGSKGSKLGPLVNKLSIRDLENSNPEDKWRYKSPDDL
ncbi:MAG: hypothetical protein FIB07_13360 [Candidatus Methanoperedens sp.]|nr:hypothetical protein [Candidatus Methanoperedens sp.]